MARSASSSEDWVNRVHRVRVRGRGRVRCRGRGRVRCRGRGRGRGRVGRTYYLQLYLRDLLEAREPRLLG